MKRLLLFTFILEACALAAGTSISTITCTSQVVTVNSTAHGIVQYQGFSIQGTSVGTYNLNSTAGTVTANSLTFTLPAGTACNGSATGGTIQPAKQIINLSSQPIASSGNISIQYVFWNTTVKPVPLSTGTISLWSGASAAENAAIAAGTTVESPGSIVIGASTPTLTISSMLTTQYASVQASYTSGFLGYSGYWWNGAAWVNQ